MPKKPPPNGYYYFMLDFKQRAERSGRRFPGGMTEVSTAASDDWKALSPAEKERYNKIAKERKNDPRPNAIKSDEKKFNSQGVSFAVLKREKAKSEEKLKQQNNFITRFVNDMSLDDLHNKLIYLIHVNIFCKTDADIYYPAEIGIVKFNLKNGVKDYFQRFIDPGDIATGYSYALKEHSEVTHKLSLQFVRSVDGSSDLPQLYNDICNFLTEDEDYHDDVNMPPLFTMYDDVFYNTSLTAVRKTLKNLWEAVYASPDDDVDRWERYFKVFPLPEMFQKLKNKCYLVKDPNVVAFPNAVLPKLELQKETYHYEAKTACKFHRDEDIIAHCSKAFVLRWAFIIRDHCTDLIGVDMYSNVVPNNICDQYSDHEDDNAGLAESMVSCRISETSIDFSSAGSRVREGINAAAGSSGLQNGNGRECGTNQRDIKPRGFGRGARSSASACDAGSFSSVVSVKRDENSDASSTISSIKEEKTESVTNQSNKSCPVAWPNVNRRLQSVPAMNDNNFPSLGRGRGALRSSRP